MPLERINQRWRPYVVTDDGVDRRFYELCGLTELKNRLRSGDVWVSASRQFKDFEAYLLEPSRFTELRKKQGLALPIEQDRDAYVAERVALLKQSLDEADGLAARGELPDAAVSESGLKITPLTNTVPEEASVLMRRAYALLPHIKITELLLEVDRWTGFSKHFTRLKTGEPAKDRILLLTAIRIHDAMRNITVGDPADPKTAVGPMVCQKQYERIQSYIHKGIEEGTAVLVGGEGHPEGLEAGFFVKPAVFVNVKNDMTIAQEEIFGPVLSVIAYDSEDEAVQIANDSRYGLHAAVLGTDLQRARRVASQIRAGRIVINNMTDDPQAP